MPDIKFATGAYRRDNGSFVEFRLVNMYAEQTPTDEAGIAILSRKGLASSYTIGTGPINGMYRGDGVLAGDVFALSGGTLYRATASLGAVVGTGVASWAGSALQVLVTRGGAIYRTTGAAPVAVTFPDAANVTSLAFLAGYFIAVRAGTHRFYWSAVLDGSSWDGLDFASAESSPDELRDCVIVNEELWLLGGSTIEPWRSTGQLATPFIRNEGRIIQRGVIGTGCAEVLDNTLFWVGDDCVVYRAAQVPQRVSDFGIEERILTSATVAAFPFAFEGHKFFCVRLDSGTWGYDVATGQWSEFGSYGLGNWRAAQAVTIDGVPLLGDAVNGTVWGFADHDDNGGEMERLFTAAFPIAGSVVPIDNVTLYANTGQTPLLSGQGSAPIVEMRYSRDTGKTFGPWRQASMGVQGKYRTQARWRRCGQFDAPGAVFEFRITDSVPFRVSAVRVNEPIGGRSR